MEKEHKYIYIIFIIVVLSFMLALINPILAVPVITDDDGNQRAETEQEQADANKVYLKLQFYTALQGHKVQLLDDTGNPIQDGRIDAMGNVNFNDLSPGKYTLVLHKKTPKTTVVKKETTYHLSTIVEACLITAICIGIITWRATKTRSERKYEILKEFQHELNIDGAYPENMTMYKPNEIEENSRESEKK